METPEEEPPTEAPEKIEPVNKKKIRSEKQLAVLAEARKKALEKIKENKAKRDYEKLQQAQEKLKELNVEPPQLEEPVDIEPPQDTLQEQNTPPIDEDAIERIIDNKVKSLQPKAKKYRVENGHYVLNQ